MGVLYVRFGSKVRLRTFWCIYGKRSVAYVEVQIDGIFCRIWNEQSCFVWI